MRLKRLFTIVDSVDERWALKLVAVVFEVNRMLATYFMQASEGFTRHGRPLVCDLSWARASVVCVSSQYLSGMARGLPEMARLFWRRPEISTFAAWVRQHSSEAASLRRAILYIASGNITRHGHFLSSPLPGLIDSRRSVDERRVIAEDRATLVSFVVVVSALVGWLAGWLFGGFCFAWWLVVWFESPCMSLVALCVLDSTQPNVIRIYTDSVLATNSHHWQSPSPSQPSPPPPPHNHHTTLATKSQHQQASQASNNNRND